MPSSPHTAPFKSIIVYPAHALSVRDVSSSTKDELAGSAADKQCFFQSNEMRFFENTSDPLLDNESFNS